MHEALSGAERLGHEVEHAAPEPLRRHHRGRIDARPALTLQPHLRPGVRVGLAHQQVLSYRIPLAAQVAGDHARRYPGGAHEVGEGRGVVPAEPLTRAEQQVVDCVLPERLGLERVHEAAPGEVVQRCGHEGGISRGLRPQGQRQLPRARVRRRRQRGVLAARGGTELANPARVGVRDRVVADRLVHRIARDQLEVIGKGDPWCRGALGEVECEPEAPLGRLQGDAVLHRLAQQLHRLGRMLGPRAPAPGAPVEVVQHRPAPVAQRRRRYLACELHAEGRIVVGDQLGNAARAHRLGQPGERLRTARDGPERAGQAREEHEQCDRQRQGQQQRAQCHAGGGARGQGRGGHRAQRRAAHPRLQRIHRRAQQRLPVEAGGQQQEQSRADKHQLVARAAHLQKLQGGHQHQQGRAGGQTVERVEARQHDAGHDERRIARSHAGGSHARLCAVHRRHATSTSALAPAQAGMRSMFSSTPPAKAAHAKASGPAEGRAVPVTARPRQGRGRSARAPQDSGGAARGHCPQGC